MTDISAYFELTLGSDPWAERVEEAVEVANQKLAGRIEQRLRQEVDLGVDKDLALKAQSIRVRAEGDRLVIDTESQGDVLGTGENTRRKEETATDLFTMGSGIPEVNPDGTLTYRKVSLDSIFRSQEDARKNANIERIAASTLQMHAGDVVEESLTEVDRRYLGRK